MKRIIIVVFTLFFAGCNATVDNGNIVTEAFLFDLASENYRIRADLYQYEYDKDLSTLTYEIYITYLQANEASSAEGLVEKIKLAQDYYFITKKKTFYIVLWFPEDKTIIVDNAYTSKIDDTVTIGTQDEVKDLSTFIDKIQ